MLGTAVAVPGSFYAFLKGETKMKEIPGGRLRHRRNSPFDDSAAERVRRMALILEDGKPDRGAVEALSRVYAGQYFDDLCDFCQCFEDAHSCLHHFLTDTEKADPKDKFLQICLQYDAIFRPLPDPIWWISGNPALVELFSAGFIEHIRQMLGAEWGEVTI